MKIHYIKSQRYEEHKALCLCLYYRSWSLFPVAYRYRYGISEAFADNLADCFGDTNYITHLSVSILDPHIDNAPVIGLTVKSRMNPNSFLWKYASPSEEFFYQPSEFMLPYVSADTFRKIRTLTDFKNLLPYTFQTLSWPVHNQFFQDLQIQS